ncbi:hypothetical protein A2U01_0085032 [Trifolium medium]|uniref:Uncharacterized protein n=1 Tax=Trifolium medium TaxID=97028 RepID=A0A392TVD2_9FABA|nr:hypothetical protein [Trifolium medium]
MTGYLLALFEYVGEATL